MKPVKSKAELRLRNAQASCRWICYACGVKVAAATGFKIPDPFINTCMGGECADCGKTGSIQPAYDYMGRGD